MHTRLRGARWGLACTCLVAGCAGRPAPAPAAAPAPAVEATAPRPAGAFDPGELVVAGHSFERRILVNGLTGVAIRDPANHAGTASVFVIYGVGKRMEGVLTTGIAHLTEHAMYAGTARTPAGQHDARIHSLGGESNAYTRQDVTIYYDSKIPVSALDEVLAMEADRMRGLTFERAAFEHERARLVAEEAGTITEAARRGELLESLVFRAHPYGAGLVDEHGHTLAGRLTLEQVRHFYDLWYHPERVAVVVAGDLEPDAALAAIERAFTAVPAGPTAPPIPREPADAPGGTATVPAPTLTRTRVSVVWVGPAANDAPTDDRDRAALSVLAAALSKENLLGGAPIDAGVGDGIDRDLVVISATGAGAERELEKRLERVRAEGIGAKELAHEVDASLKALAERPLVAERPYFALAGAVGADVALGLAEVAAGTEETLRSLTPEIVRDAARRWLAPERAWVVRFEPTDPSLAARPLPDDPQALQHLAEEAAESGELDRAIAAYEKLLAGNPNRMWTVIYLYEVGALRLRLGDLAGARRDLERALALVDYPAVRELLAEVASQEKERAGVRR